MTPTNFVLLNKGQEKFEKYGTKYWTVEYLSSSVNVGNGTLSGAIFDGFSEVFWIFLKNEPGGVEKIKPYVLDKSALS